MANNISFTNEYPEGKKSYFQSEIKCTKEELESMLGYSMTESNEVDEDWRFEGSAYMENVARIPLIIHNCRKYYPNEEPLFVWQIYTEYFDEGLQLKNYFNKILHPEDFRHNN